MFIVSYDIEEQTEIRQGPIKEETTSHVCSKNLLRIRKTFLKYEKHSNNLLKISIRHSLSKSACC